MKQIRKGLTYANVMSTIAVFLVIGGASAFAATELASNSVGTKQLKGNAVTSAKIKKEAVGAAKIKNGAVSTGKLAAAAVTAEKLGAASVTSEKLGATSVTSEKLGNSAVTSEKLATASVTGEKLAANSVGTTKIGNSAVTNEKLADSAVNGAKVQDGSLSGTDVDQSTLNAVKAANVYGVTFQEVGGPEIINASDPGIKSGGCFLVCAVEFPRDVTECSYTTSPIDQDNGSGEAAMSEAFPGGDVDTVLVVMWNDEGGLIAHDFAMTVVCPTTA